MSSLNKVILIGRLGQDPELRYTQSQQPVAQLSLATSESYQKDGQKVEQTEWHRVIVWGKQAENCGKYLSKGRMVCVEGKLQTKSWQDKDGQKRFTTEIVAHGVVFLAGGEKEATIPGIPAAEHVNTGTQAMKMANAPANSAMVTSPIQDPWTSYQSFEDIPFAPSR